MMKHPSLLALVVLLTFAVAAPSVLADETPDPKAEAQAHFDKGKQLFAEGRYFAAADEFSQAYAIAPRPQVLYNIALSQDKAGNLVAAVEGYRRYLLVAAAGGESEAIRKRLLELEAQVGEVAAGCAVRPCIVVVDGEELGPAPVSVLLKPGDHLFSATHNGQTVDEIEIPLRPGDKISVTLATSLPPSKAAVVVPGKAPSQPPPAKPEPSEAPEQRQPEQRQPEPAAKEAEVPLGIPFWVASSVAAAAGVTTIVFGVKALDDQNQFKDSNKQDEGLKKQGEKDQLLTNIFIGVTAAAGATAVAFAVYEIWFSGHDDSDSVSLAPGPGLGLAAVGRF